MSNQVIFRLGSKEEPASTLRGGSTLLSPIVQVLTDEGKKWIRYIPYEKTCWVENQKTEFDPANPHKHGRPEKIPFTQNAIVVFPDEDPCLLEYLQAYPAYEENREYQKYQGVLAYHREDLEGDAMNDLEYAKARAEVLNTIISMTDEEAIDLAIMLERLPESRRKSVKGSLIKQALIEVGEEDPSEIMDAVNSDLREDKALIISALDKGILVYGNDKKTLITFANGDKFVQNMMGENALHDAALKVNRSEGVKNSIRTAMHQNSQLDKDFKNDIEKDAELAIPFLKERGIETAEDLFNTCESEYKEDLSYCYKMHAPYYKLIYKDKDVFMKDDESKVKGKKAAIEFLSKNKPHFNYLASRLHKAILKKEDN